MPVAVQIPVDGQGPGRVIALRQTERVAAGRVAVLLAAVELVLLLVEAMDQVAGAAARQSVRVTYAVGRPEGVRIGTRLRGCRDVCVELERVAVVRRPPLVEEVAVEGRPVGRVRVLALVAQR